MKKFFTLLLFASLMTAPNVFADGDDNNTGGNNGGNDSGNNGGDTQTPPTPPEKIPISPNPFPGNPDPGKLGPRSLSAISGWCANDTIQLFFAQDMGTVFVTVINTTTGDMWYCNAESSDGVVVIEFEPTPGNYTITIETQTAGTYYGEFAL